MNRRRFWQSAGASILLPTLTATAADEDGSTPLPDSSPSPRAWRLQNESGQVLILNTLYADSATITQEYGVNAHRLADERLLHWEEIDYLDAIPNRSFAGPVNDLFWEPDFNRAVLVVAVQGERVVISMGNTDEETTGLIIESALVGEGPVTPFGFSLDDYRFRFTGDPPRTWILTNSGSNEEIRVGISWWANPELLHRELLQEGNLIFSSNDFGSVEELTSPFSLFRLWQGDFFHNGNVSHKFIGRDGNHMITVTGNAGMDQIESVVRSVVTFGEPKTPYGFMLEELEPEPIIDNASSESDLPNNTQT